MAASGRLRRFHPPFTSRSTGHASIVVLRKEDRANGAGNMSSFAGWQEVGLAVQREMHFGDRVVTCFVDRPSNYTAMLQDAVRQRGDGEALVADGERLSWTELERRSTALARGLLARGLRHGDRIGLLLGNHLEFVLALLAAARIGAIVVPINIREQMPGIAAALNATSACMVIYNTELSALLPPAEQAPALRLRVARTPCPGSLAFAELLDDGSGPDCLPVAEEDTLLILFTSGTTGKPKGVEFSHLSVVHSAMHSEVCAGLTEVDRSVIAIPLSFTGGVVSAFTPMVRCAGTAILLPEFKAAGFLATAAAERMTHTLMVPAMYELCLRQPDTGLDLSHWRVGVFGAAPMPAATVERLALRFPRLRLQNSYGATEAGGPAVFMSADETALHRDSVGRAFTCVELCIMDEVGRELPAGETGELWIRSPSCAARFWGDPESSHREYIGGWWRSGDIASLDEAGRLRLMDRKKDMLNRGGLKISSTQVEYALHEHPAVLECAVIGRPDAVLGERVYAFVRLADPTVTADALKAFLLLRLADYKVPEFIEIADEPLPRNVNGKLLKRDLREAVLRTLSPA